MVVATEELSRASLGIGGSLITRPGDPHPRPRQGRHRGAEARTGCPSSRRAEVMPAVAVTEPDFGSDVAGIKVTATPAAGPDGAPGYVINGVKTWCTFAARADALALLARTDPDRSKGHRGLSLFIVPKERGDGHGFALTQPGGGKMEGRPIDTIGYRGHAQLRGRARQLVGARRSPGRRRRRASARASTCRWRASRTDASRPPPARSA